MSLELKKEVWVGDKSLRVYGLNPGDWIRSPRVSIERREESRTEPLGTSTVRARGGRGRQNRSH